MRLDEIAKEKKEIHYNTEQNELYHLTDYKGLTISVIYNNLTAKTQPYISTTKSIQEGVVGRDFYEFKFVLDAKKLAQEYGIFSVKDYRRVGEELELMEENEVGINAKSINLFEYLKRLIIVTDLFSRKFIQWMFYDVKTDDNIGIKAIKEIIDRNIPILTQKGSNISSLSNEQKEFLEYCFNLSEENYDFSQALKELSKYYEIKDHYIGDNYKIIKPTQLEKEDKKKEIVEIINNTLTQKKIKDISKEEIIEMLSNILDILGYQKEFKNKFLKKIKELGLDSPLLAPVNWSSTIRSLIVEEPWEEIKNDLEFMKENELDSLKKSYERFGEEFVERTHMKTGMA